MIDRAGILGELAGPERACIESLDCFGTIGSTSTWLVNEAPPAPDRCRIAIAEEQTAGRGRRDKHWVSPKGAGLWLSLSYTFGETPERLSCLTLAIGAGLAELLQTLGADVRLKWPNDLIANDGKLGGILAETQPRVVSQGDRHRTVVVGVGINLDLPAALSGQMEKARGTGVTSLAECVDVVPARAALAAAVICTLICSLRRYASAGLAAGLESWQRYDWLAGKRIAVEHDGRRISGTAEGIDADGALLLRTNGSVRRIVSGSVELDGPAEACA